MKPSAFDYHVPKTADEAVSLLAEFGEEAKILAGGQSLIPMLSLRLTSFEHLVDIWRIDDLKGIEQRDSWLWVGACTTQAAIEKDPTVDGAAPLLARATPLIGHFQIRNRGTIGGSIAHADPAAEDPTVAVTLDAEMETCSPRGSRSIPARTFFAGLWTTALEPDELLTGVRFPIWTGRCGFAIEEFARRHGDFAIAGAAVAVELDSGDRVRRCALGLMGLSATPVRADATEAEVLGRTAQDITPGDIGRHAVAKLADVPDDLHGSADYRTKVGAAMVERAWNAAIREARGE